MAYKGIWCPETHAISAIEAAQALSIMVDEDADEKLHKAINDFVLAGENLISQFKEKLDTP